MCLGPEPVDTSPRDPWLRLSQNREKSRAGKTYQEREKERNRARTNFLSYQNDPGPRAIHLDARRPIGHLRREMT
jgi:thymidylate kinase